MKSFMLSFLLLALTFADMFPSAEHAHSKMAEVEVNTVPLSPGVPQVGLIPPADEFRVCRIGDTQYTIEIPTGAMKLRVLLSSTTHVDLYIRRDQPVIRQDGTILADFKETTVRLNKSLDLPALGSLPLQEGTYFIAVGNCSLSEQSNFLLIAGIFAPSNEETVALTPDAVEVGSIPASTSNCLLGQTQYTFPATVGPLCGSSSLYRVELMGDQNVDLYVRFNQMVTMEDGKIIADFSSRSDSGAETLIPGPVAQNGVYYVAVANCSSEKADFTIGVRLLPFEPPISTCEIERNPSGASSLIIRGNCIKRGASITVGGVTPKTVKFKQPDQTGTFYAKVIAKGRVCRGLPGAIIIRNPGEQIARAFQCNEVCRN
ncbi:MAG: hypothetical protein AB1631_03335 [Acidobacteriota bacterium]